MVSGKKAPSRGLDRRTLLRLTGASTVTGALATLAGCSSNDGGDGSDGGGGDGGDGGGGDGGDGGGGDGGDGGDGGTSGGDVIPEIHFMTWVQSYDPVYFEATRMIISELEELGLVFDMDPQQYPNPLIDQLFAERGFDMFYMSMEGVDLRLDPSFYLNTVLHSSSAAEGGWNFSGFENDEFDALSVEQQQLLDQEERRDVVYEAQALAHQEQAWTVHVSPNLPFALNTEKFDVPDDLVPGEGHFDMWYLTSVESKTDDNTYVIGRLAPEIRTFNPLQITDSGDISIFRTMYDPLMRLDPTARPVEWIIDDLTVEDDTTATVTLTEGLSFHDGEDLTADDVVFSFHWQKDQQSPYVATFLETLDEAVAVDDRTVTFNLTEPYAPFTSITLTQVPILPQHIWDGMSNPTEHQNEPAIGSGPFVYDRHETGQQLALDAFSEHPHAPNVDTLRIALMGDQSSAVESLTRGQVDSIDQISTTLWQNVRDNDSTTLTFTPDHGLQAVLMNQRRGPPFDDLAFRRAVSHAIPRERIINQLLEGEASPGGSIISDANEFWHNPEVEPNEYDIDRARQILEDAGYSWNDEGRLLFPE